MIEFEKRSLLREAAGTLNIPAREDAGHALTPNGGHQTGDFERVSAGVFSLALILFVGCATSHPPSPARDTPPLHRFDFSSPHMGTLFTISLYASDKPTAEKAANAAFQCVASLDETMSDYRADSELMQLCDKPFGQPVPVSPDLFAILQRAQAVSKLTHGAFDVTIGPFSHLWRFSRRKKTLPSSDEIATARAAFGWQHLRLDTKNRTVTLRVPNMRLDLGGIAKGYAADKALKVLKSRGINRALVAASGDIAIADAPPQQDGWKVGISPIDSHTNDTAASLVLHNAGVSTAGDTEQAIEINGNRYSHIVDPKTGLGLTNRIQVTIVAPDATSSDGLDTGLCVMGATRALTLIDSLPHVAAIILTKGDEGTHTFKSRRFARVLKTKTAP